MTAPNIGRFMAPVVQPYAYRAFLMVSGGALLPFWAFSSDEWVWLDLWYHFEETNHYAWPTLSARALPTGHRLGLVVVNQSVETWKRAFHSPRSLQKMNSDCSRGSLDINAELRAHFSLLTEAQVPCCLTIAACVVCWAEGALWICSKLSEEPQNLELLSLSTLMHYH